MDGSRKEEAILNLRLFIAAALNFRFFLTHHDFSFYSMIQRPHPTLMSP